MGTPEDDARLLAALNQKGQGGTPDPAADAAAKAAADAAAVQAAALAAAQTPDAIAAKAAADAAALAADAPAQILKLQLASQAATQASQAKPDDAVLAAAADAALKAVNDFITKAPAPAQTVDVKVKDGDAKPEDIKLKVPDDKSVSEAEVQRLELFAKKHKFSQSQADALLESAKERELDGRAKALKIQQGYLDVIQKDVELGGTTERVNLTLEKARLGAKHLFTQEDLLAMTKDGSANSPALVRACFRHYQTALASPSLVGGNPIKTAEAKGDARNPEDLAKAFAADRVASKK